MLLGDKGLGATPWLRGPPRHNAPHLTRVGRPEGEGGLTQLDRDATAQLNTTRTDNANYFWPICPKCTLIVLFQCGEARSGTSPANLALTYVQAPVSPPHPPHTARPGAA